MNSPDTPTRWKGEHQEECRGRRETHEHRRGRSMPTKSKMGAGMRLLFPLAGSKHQGCFVSYQWGRNTGPNEGREQKSVRAPRRGRAVTRASNSRWFGDWGWDGNGDGGDCVEEPCACARSLAHSAGWWWLSPAGSGMVWHGKVCYGGFG